MKLLKTTLTYLALVILLSFPFWIYFKAQSLTDWWQLRNYTPPAAVIELSSQDGMTAYATHVFYVNHPAVESKVSQFRMDCKESEKTIVLGCYHSNQAGIFVYMVDDPRLSGVQQVTAAHEMLHAGYDRLNTKEKRSVNAMLEEYYKTVKDQRIIDTINSYKESEPNDVVNEMHSIFGTEIASLPTPLEKYYSRYFTNRAAVVGFANNYQNEFTSRSDQVKADDAQLAALKASINSQENSLQILLVKVNSDRDRLDSLRSGGQIQSYNAGVASFNSEVDDYNFGVKKLKVDIAAYNSLVAKRNTLAEELASLSKSLDTRLTPQATQ
ncbi:hypothetical protein KW803_01865 [Candidatus Saccharibacteria bacterium]|nr:hypothetical protein [Candidatus Saccharibacteria bacterium]